VASSKVEGHPSWTTLFLGLKIIVLDPGLLILVQKVSGFVDKLYTRVVRAKGTCLLFVNLAPLPVPYNELWPLICSGCA
jgi:hypothetical protein